MDINFELYKVFYHVAKSLSFSEASGYLYISQSAVSQSVKLLEEKLNCKLFTRNTKKVTLTQEGEILFKHVEQAYNFIKTGERTLSEVRSLKKGEVRIGASDTICKYILLPYFQKFNRMYPQIKIHVTNRTSIKCLELLENGSLDTAVVNVPEKGVGKNLQVLNIKQVKDVLIAGPAFLHLQEKTISLEELRQYPLLMLEKNTTTREFLDSFLQKQGISVTPEIELESVDLLIELAKIGLGLSFVVRDYIERELSAGEIFIVNTDFQIPVRNLGIVTGKTVPIPVAAQKFIELFL